MWKRLWQLFFVNKLTSKNQHTQIYLCIKSKCVGSSNQSTIMLVGILSIFREGVRKKWIIDLLVRCV